MRDLPHMVPPDAGTQPPADFDAPEKLRDGQENPDLYRLLLAMAETFKPKVLLAIGGGLGTRALLDGIRANGFGRLVTVDGDKGESRDVLRALYGTRFDFAFVGTAAEQLVADVCQIVQYGLLAPTGVLLFRTGDDFGQGRPGDDVSLERASRILGAMRLDIPRAGGVRMYLRIG